MSVEIDSRLTERRREVAEERAKRNVRRLLKFFLLLGVLGGLVWFVFSPWMSARQIRTTGIVVSDTEAILVEHGIVPGTPLVMIRTAPVVAAIESDPWVMRAEVILNWPDDVVVRVTERSPRAWVETASGWTRRAEDGYSVPSRATPDNTLGWVRLPLLADEDAVDSDLVRGSIEFLMALPPETATGTAVRFHEGELWATVEGYQVRLGRPVEMSQKAWSLMALIAREPAANSILILVAPTHPATSQPDGSEPSDPDEDDSTDEESDETDS